MQQHLFIFISSVKQIGGQACLFISLLNGEWIDKYDDYSNYPHQNKTYSNDLKPAGFFNPTTHKRISARNESKKATAQGGHKTLTVALLVNKKMNKNRKYKANPLMIPDVLENLVVTEQ